MFLKKWGKKILKLYLEKSINDNIFLPWFCKSMWVWIRIAGNDNGHSTGRTSVTGGKGRGWCSFFQSLEWVFKNSLWPIIRPYNN